MWTLNKYYLALVMARKNIDKITQTSKSNSAFIQWNLNFRKYKSLSLTAKKKTVFTFYYLPAKSRDNA